MDAIQLKTEGNVHRHVLRGATETSGKERRLDEDRHCTAGLRNPSDLVCSWPSLWRVMRTVRGVLDSEREKTPELQGLRHCCGEDPAREPPSEETVHSVRRRVLRELGYSCHVPFGVMSGVYVPPHTPRAHDRRYDDGRAEAKHPSSPLRPAVFSAVQSLCQERGSNASFPKARMSEDMSAGGRGRGRCSRNPGSRHARCRVAAEGLSYGAKC